jgi:predicted nucleic-acid-binding protein
VNISVDTNILLRFILADDEAQHQSALRLFDEAGSIAIATVTLCEMVWVLQRYKIGRQEIAEQINALAHSDKVVVADDEVNAGLDLLEAGGDFADGVAAYVGRRLAPNGAAAFASFDQAAVRLLSQNGHLAFVPVA